MNLGCLAVGSAGLFVIPSQRSLHQKESERAARSRGDRAEPEPRRDAEPGERPQSRVWLAPLPSYAGSGACRLQPGLYGITITDCHFLSGEHNAKSRQVVPPKVKY